MQQSPDLWQRTHTQLSPYFSLPQVQEEASGERLLLEALEHVVAEMLQRAPDRLFAVLYQLDVPEHQLHVALDRRLNVSPPRSVAHLILRREYQKAATRAASRLAPEEEVDEDDGERW